MSPLGRVSRRPDAWASPHERARSRAAERLDEPLEPNEAAWLDEHLLACDPCFASAKAYEADRTALRSLRDTAPEPPRDLWARTSAAIEREAAGHRRASTGSVRRSPLTQWGAIAGIAVVAVAVGSSVLQGGWLASPSGSTDPGDGSFAAALSPQPTASAIEAVPAATPMAVAAGPVGWFDVGADGSYAYNVADVDEVCAQIDQASCAALVDRAGQRVALASAPKSIITSPSTGQAIVVGADGSAGNQVFVLSLPGDPARTPTPTTLATPAPVATPTPSTAAPGSTATPDPGSPAPGDTPAPSDPAASSVPASPPASDPPSATPEPTPTPEVTPTASPAPTPTAIALAIVSGVTVVGDAAAFSSDGEWFAFTARPADGSAGPDIYLWHVGDPKARAVTSDHRSAFASWADGLVIGSRPAATADDRPSTFTIEPKSGDETPLAIEGWRPAVDPTGRNAVVWDGSIARGADGRTYSPADGRLVLVGWSGGGTAAIDKAAPVITTGPISDFTVRWDDDGDWLAVWVADATDPTVGRLSLLHLDLKRGTMDRPDAGPQDVPALPGFSIESGRLAWATPPSQDGEGSRVQIVAWSSDGVGSIETAPGQDVVVVR